MIESWGPDTREETHQPRVTGWAPMTLEQPWGWVEVRNRLREIWAVPGFHSQQVTEASLHPVLLTLNPSALSSVGCLPQVIHKDVNHLEGWELSLPAECFFLNSLKVSLICPRSKKIYSRLSGKIFCVNNIFISSGCCIKIPTLWRSLLPAPTGRVCGCLYSMF